jgi:hypothetical protein
MNICNTTPFRDEAVEDLDLSLVAEGVMLPTLDTFCKDEVVTCCCCCDGFPFVRPLQL